MLSRKDALVLRRTGGRCGVCGEVCLGSHFKSSLLWQESIFPSWWHSQGGDLWQLSSFWGFIFKRIRGVQRKPFPVSAVFQVPTAPNNQYAKAAYFGVACPELLQSYFGETHFAALQLLGLSLPRALLAQPGCAGGGKRRIGGFGGSSTQAWIQ